MLQESQTTGAQPQGTASPDRSGGELYATWYKLDYSLRHLPELCDLLNRTYREFYASMSPVEMVRLGCERRAQERRAKGWRAVA